MQSSIEAYMKYADGKRAIAFCANVEHAEHVAASFEKHGIPAAAISARTSHERRAELVVKFNNGEVKMLCGACVLLRDALNGAKAEAIIVMRPTGSGQTHAKIMRHAQTPDCIVIDMAGNTLRNGFPEDFEGRLFVPSPIFGFPIV